MLGPILFSAKRDWQIVHLQVTSSMRSSRFGCGSRGSFSVYSRCIFRRLLLCLLAVLVAAAVGGHSSKDFPVLASQAIRAGRLPPE